MNVKQRIAVYIVFIFTFAFAIFGGESRVTMGVFDFAGADPDVSKGIAEIFATDLGNSKELQIIERGQIQKIFDENKLSYAGITAENNFGEAGKLLNVDKLIIGSYLANGDKIIINARLVDVEKGVIERGINREGDIQNLYRIVHQLAQNFHKSITGKWIPDIVIIDDSGAKNEALAKIDPMIEIANPNSKIKVDLALNKNSFRQEEAMVITFKADVDCYINIFNINIAGKVTLLYPNTISPDNKIRKNKTYTIPEKNARYELAISGYPGEEQIVALVSAEPMEFIEEQKKFLKDNFMPEISSSSNEFITRDVKLKLKNQLPAQWATARVKFFIE